MKVKTSDNKKTTSPRYNLSFFNSADKIKGTKYESYLHPSFFKRADFKISKRNPDYFEPILHDFSKFSIFSSSVPIVQPKLKISAPNDKYEREVDRVRAALLNEKGIDTHSELPDGKMNNENSRQNMIEKGFEGSSSGRNNPSNISSGKTMDSNTLDFMESKFGKDFSDVRIHTDEKAHQMNQMLHARAFTYGNDVHFKAREYNPSSQEGKKLLVHELSHVVQQRTHGQQIQRKLELRPPGKGEASAFNRAQELVDRLNKVSPAIQYELKGQKLLYTIKDKAALTHFDKKMKEFIDREQVIPMRLITSKGYVGGGPLLADSFILGYVDIDDLLANDMYSFQSDLLHFLTERFQVKDYARRIGTNFSARFPKAHRAGKEAEAENLRALFNDPSIVFLYENVNPNGTWVNAFKSKDNGYRIFQVVRKPGREIAGGVMWVRKKDGTKVSMDEFKKERAGALVP